MFILGLILLLLIPLACVCAKRFEPSAAVDGWNILNSSIYYFMFQHSIIPLF